MQELPGTLFFRAAPACGRPDRRLQRSFRSEPELELEPDLPAVVVGRCRFAAVVVRGVGLYLQAVADDVARHADRGLVPVSVPGQRLYPAVGKERRVAQGDLPFAVEQVAGLQVETASVVDEGVAVGVEEGGRCSYAP